jgi:hypothetical protein
MSLSMSTLSNRMMLTVREQDSIRQGDQIVMERMLLELFLRRIALRNVDNDALSMLGSAYAIVQDHGIVA